MNFHVVFCFCCVVCRVCVFFCVLCFCWCFFVLGFRAVFCSCLSCPSVGPPKISLCFTPFRRKFRSVVSLESSRGSQGRGPPKVRVWGSLGLWETQALGPHEMTPERAKQIEIQRRTRRKLRENLSLHPSGPLLRHSSTSHLPPFWALTFFQIHTPPFGLPPFWPAATDLGQTASGQPV